MRLPTAGARLCLLFAIGQAFVIQVALAQAPAVTATKWVENWEEKDRPKELLRKINGRWWSQDNREVTPPANGGFFWTLDSAPGVVQFFHHRPLQLDRAESLHLWMRPQDVEAVLGQPNRIFGTDNHGFWSYYAANGTKLSVRFMGDGVLGEATYNPLGGKSYPVASVQSELGGQDVYKLLSQRATKRLQDSRPTKPGTVQTRALTVSQAPPLQPVPEVTAPPRTVPADALASIAPGADRQEVLTKLGEPALRSTITSDEGTRESLTYYVEGGDPVVIRLVNGKVASVK